ncbi:MAG TPA: hypothetical protein VEP90_19545 [Methylomirabilota bacterium]|nr:hypothetical protein [Methylomirabilota bacterium]
MEETAIIRMPSGLAEKINEIAVHKLKNYNTVSEFVIDAARRYLERLDVKP